MASPVLQFKRGDAGVAGTVPALRPGEPAISLNNFDFFIGIDTSVVNNKFFGSHRYWEREDGDTALRLRLVDKTGNVGNSIHLKSPDNHTGITTYTFPPTPEEGYFLKTNSSGTLSWEEVVSDFSISADSGTTDNVSTGQTITFSGGTNVNTQVSDNQITINLDDNISISNFNVTGISTFNGNVILGDDAADLITVVGLTTFTTSDVYIDNQLFVGGVQITGGTLIGQDIETRHLSVSGIATFGSGVGVTQFSSSVGAGNSASSVPTSSAVIDYVETEIENINLTLGIDADTGGPSTVATSQTLSINGTTNEVNTSVSGQTITIGLPDNVIVGASLTVTTALTTPTINATNLKANDGTSAITITDITGVVGLASDLTVGGNLYVNGSTTQVNTTSLTIEDTLVELGMVDGSAPGSDLNKDLGLLLNYFSGTAKKAAVFWDDSESRIVFADNVTESSSVLTVESNAYASIEIESLWINDCAGQSQVISCADGERKLENITIDAGTF
jgi:hypothetical protein